MFNSFTFSFIISVLHWQKCPIKKIPCVKVAILNLNRNLKVFSVWFCRTFSKSANVQSSVRYLREVQNLVSYKKFPFLYQGLKITNHYQKIHLNISHTFLRQFFKTYYRRMLLGVIYRIQDEPVSWLSLRKYLKHLNTRVIRNFEYDKSRLIFR